MTVLRIGIAAPIDRRLPPTGYGPWEQVAHDLAEGLVADGHDVTVYAAAGSVTSARLVATAPGPLDDVSWWEPDRSGRWFDPGPVSRVVEQAHLARAVEHAAEAGLDVLHSHLHVHGLVFSRLSPTPIVTTLHGSAWNRAHHPVLGAYREQSIVSISDAERSFFPELNYVATVHNGIDVAGVPTGSGGDRLAFVGRMAPEKAPHLAVEVARASGRPLVLAGPTEPVHQGYFDDLIRPQLGAAVEYVGALDRAGVAEVLGGSLTTLFPLAWDEPFGLVAVESMAAGTPVIGWRRGALPELIEPGRTGALASTVAEAAGAVETIQQIDRGECRAVAERRFSRAAMAAGYAEAYRTVLDGAQTIAENTSSSDATANPIDRSAIP